ncbi:patatin-like phospholipase family protein [Flavobacterium sp. DG1-102-2]|uniref:patatin-like phospholipase family protein n=1 Tax=Flavobacterium sp. DG1-102-2 TaxID=3081663 RepID=UPI002949A29B|nr:patatin-like phospholipase family protein [Flavobacterium sp. DG1-102-2]MDV6169593.1 patatin-like phospholipase family protein [Flavobacterium sp. DG1-102-2]
MKKLVLLLLALSFFSSVTGQEKKHKPKVGVVLSGGGAKGLAHIGVLKVLEEAGVEISYIGGTSMGAIVGGLYASGYSAKQLDSIFTTLDADALLRDFTPRGSKNFFERRNDEIYALSLPFKNFKIGFPNAFSKGLYNYNTINRLTDHVRHVREFDSLPIPFVCIATDIETGKEVVLRKGVLPDAILASGAFPSLYSPVEIDDRLLIDGGVTNNYPIEEVKAMGADIIIGVDVQDPLRTRDQIKGATGVLLQINNYQMIQKMETKSKATDIYIKPDIKGFTVISFDEGRAIIDKGEESAMAIIEQLVPLGVGHPVHREAIICKDSICIDQIKISGLHNYTRSYVIGKLNFKPGSKISYSKLNDGITSLNATQNFTAISYNFKKDTDGESLRLNVTENPINRYIKFGLHYDGLYKSALLVNYTHKNLLRRNDVASVDAMLGDNFRYNLDYYIDNGFYLSYGLHSYFSQFNRNVSQEYGAQSSLSRLFDGDAANIDFTDWTNQIYVQTIFAKRFMAGGGIEYKHIKVKSETTNVSPIFDNSDYLSVYGYLKFDSYDDKYFPSEGWFFSGEGKSYLLSSDYTGGFNRFSIIKGELSTAKTLFKNVNAKAQAEMGFALGDESISTFDFILGGYGYNMTNNFRHFYGYDFLSIAGNSYIKGALTLDWEFYKKNHLNFTANYANVGHNLFDEGKMFSLPTFSGYAFGYGMETIIGPVEVKHSWSPDTGEHYTWVSVGFWF